jgi:squalene monooxygenase
VSDFDAERMLGYAIFKDGKSAKLPYPLENFLSDVAGRSFHIGPANSAG